MNNGDFALARNTDGSLDTSFSGDGKQTTTFDFVEGAEAVALQSDGKIVAAGNTVATGDSQGVLALARDRLQDEVEWLRECARWLAQLDLGIFVGTADDPEAAGRSTAAGYDLGSTQEVESFLERLVR